MNNIYTTIIEYPSFIGLCLFISKHIINYASFKKASNLLKRMHKIVLLITLSIYILYISLPIINKSPWQASLAMIMLIIFDKKISNLLYQHV